MGLGAAVEGDGAGRRPPVPALPGIGQRHGLSGTSPTFSRGCRGGRGWFLRALLSSFLSSAFS